MEEDPWHWECDNTRQAPPGHDVPVIDLESTSDATTTTTTATTTKGRPVLYLFSGPSGRKDGLAAYLRAVKVGCTECDITNTHLEDQDILDDSVWLRIKNKLLAGIFAFLFGSPPCRTFSPARGSGPGPPVLRDVDYVYGYPKSQSWRRLEHHHYERIREDNLLAERTAEACAIMDSWGRGYAVEQPEPWGGAVSMFEFDSFKKLRAAGGKLVHFHQCPYEAPCTKPIIIFHKIADCSSLELYCDHEAVWQTRNDGSYYMAPHPSYVGKKDSKGAYLTSHLSAYPAKLNCKLAAIINKAILDQASASS